MTKKQVVSFGVDKDPNAEPTKRFILRVCVNGVCVMAPRYSFLHTALEDIEGYIKEFGGNQNNFKIEVKI